MVMKVRWHVFKFIVACLFSVGVGIGTHVQWFHGEGSHAAHLRVERTTIGVEWTPGVSPVPVIWTCDPLGAWSWHCPVPSGDRSYTHTDLGTGAEVTPLTGVMIDGLTAQMPERDWASCSMTEADDTLIIWCPDGYRMES